MFLFFNHPIQLKRKKILAIFYSKVSCSILKWYYLPTPPLGQDMTQGQFLSGV